jgi:molybdopterin-guanine dinucleotide biosynthesis protein A
MGSDKGLVLLNGKPMIQYCIDTLESMGLPIIIISNNSEYERFGYPVHKDLVSEKGPVGGIFTALKCSNTDKTVIISCDTPFVSKDLLDILIEASQNYDVTIPVFKERQHPLIGVYNRSGLPVFEIHLKNDQLKLQTAIATLNTNIVSMTDQPKVMSMMFKNINTQDELKLLEL